MRIVSLLPAATEILYAIGAGDAVVGVTHECDFPPDAAGKPAVIRPRVDPAAPPAEIDRQVRDLVERGESVYAIDAELLARLAPDLIVTQDLCHVCAASREDLATALARWAPERAPRVVTFTPRALADVWTGIREIGEAAGHDAEASALALKLAKDVAATESAMTDIAERPRVLCLEWFEPPYVGGHWVPEMVRLAGGIDVFGCEGEPSFTVTWPQILEAQPEVILLMSCGYGVERNVAAWRATPLPSGWNDLQAARSGRVYAVDANAHFSRSGPRLAEGVALLAGLLHPERAAPGLSREATLSSQWLSASAGGRNLS